MKGLRLSAAQSTLGRALQRWGLSWRALAVLLALLYVTPIGGTRAGTYHFPLVALSHLLAFVALAAWMAYSLAQGRWLPKTPLDASVLVFYLLCVVSTALSTDLRLSVENLAHLTILVLLYYMVVHLLLSGWKISDFVTPMLMVAAVVVIAEILELAVWLGIWLVGTGEFSPLLALGEYRRRLVMGPANVLAWYLVLVGPLILARLLRSPSLRGRIQMGILAVGAGIVLASTLSRSGLIGMAVAVATFTLLTITPRIAYAPGSLRTYLRRPVVIGALVAAASLTTALVVSSFYLLPSRLYTVSVRFELWRAAAAIIAARPLAGGGPGTFGYLLHQVPDPNPLGADMYYNNAHNGFINVGAETGLPSLAAGLWLIAALTVAGWRNLSRGGIGHPGRSTTIAACLAGTLGLMASMLFDVPWVFPLTTIHVVLFAAIIASPLSSLRRAAWQPLRWGSASLAILAMAMLGWSDVGHAFQQRAVDSIHNGRLEEAVTALSRSATWDPFLSIYRFQLGIAQGRFALEREDQALLNQAVHQYEEAIARGGDTAINNGNLAWLEWEAGRPGNAIDRMKRAVSQAPRESYYRVGLGYLLEETGDYQGAEAAYTHAIQYSPSLIDSGFWQTSAYRNSFKAGVGSREGLSNFATAWAAFVGGGYARATELLEDMDQSSSVLVLQGRVEIAAGDYATAEEHLNEALTRSWANTDAYLARGQLYLAKGEREPALRDLRIAGLLGDWRADLLLGEVAYRDGRLEKAIALLGGGVPHCVAVTASHDYASQVYHRSDISADFWPESITCAPYDHLVPYYLHLAIAYRAVGSVEDAEGVCQWLGTFYEASYLGSLDVNNDRQDACPAGTAELREYDLPIPWASTSSSQRGGST